MQSFSVEVDDGNVTSGDAGGNATDTCPAVDYGWRVPGGVSSSTSESNIRFSPVPYVSNISVPWPVARVEVLEW